MKAEQSRATKPTGQLPAGVYWIGDLAYVIEDWLGQGLHKLEGVHRTQEGQSFAIYETAHGDGIFDDNDGDDYGSDSANIGCIPIDAIDQVSGLGHLVRFHSPFVCRWIEEGGFICFGDLAIKTSSLGDAEYPDAISLLKRPSSGTSVENAADEPACAYSSYIKLDPDGLADLILQDEDEVDSDTQLVMREIARSMYGDYNELLGYPDFCAEDQKFLIQMFHLVFHSDLDEFTDYFQGYYGTPNNETHAVHLKEGRIKIELYAFLDKLDWPRILKLCRRHATPGVVATIFKAWTGCDYAAERARHPVEAWDGTPRWPMENGKYLPSE